MKLQTFVSWYGHQPFQLQLQIFICNILHFSFQFLFSLEWTMAWGQKIDKYVYIIVI